MRSLERRFSKIAEKNYNWSPYLCFAEAIKGQDFNKQTIHSWFQKLVDKDDYAKSEKNGVLGFLGILTKPLRTA